MISRVARLIGTASPRPTPATAVFTPTMRPCPSASTPPELPGFSAASVWITSSMTRPDAVGSDLPRFDTMPAVTLPASPIGFPRATTSWPTRRAVASPSGTGGGTGPLARSTARSDSTSRPTTSTVTDVPSPKVASADTEPATTWALVSSTPASEITLALPAPPPRGERTARLATLGSTSRATRVTTAE